MAIEVSEYRNGVLIGTIERDIEIIFDNCTNNLPSASGFNGTNNYSVHVCANSNLSLWIRSSDLDTAQHTWLSWNGGIIGASFTTSGTYRDTGHFFWQPDTSFISVQPYLFSVTVTDSACPYIGVGTYTYAVYVDSCFATGMDSPQGNCVQEFSANYERLHRMIHFQYRLNHTNAVEISLFDLTGRELDQLMIEKSLQAGRDLDVSKLSKGLYLLNLKTTDGISKTLRVVID